MSDQRSTDETNAIEIIASVLQEDIPNLLPIAAKAVARHIVDCLAEVEIIS